jgi:hypothetical protein
MQEPEEVSFEVLVWSGQMLSLHSDLRDVPVEQFQVAKLDLLSAIAKRAQESGGVDWPFAYMHFVTAPDSEGRRYQAPYLSPYVAEDGALTWPGLQLEGIKVADAIRTADAGLFEGDPRALLVEEPVGGDGVPPVAELQQVLVNAGEIYAGIQAVVAAAKGLHKVIEASQRQWRMRNATPPDVIRFVLMREEWDYPTLARLLDVSFSTVVELLESLGFVSDSSAGRVYTLSKTSEVAVLRHEIEEQVLHGNPRDTRRSYWEHLGRDPDNPLNPIERP